jgi:hypothetical protein
MKRLSRREIIKGGVVIAGAAVIAPAILWKSLKGRALKDIPVTLLGPSAIAGHRLRDGFQFPEPSEFKNTQVLIVGGGMSGLSAGYRFLKRGLKDFKVLELENEVGGNSRSGKNDMSRYPRGAHYITLLNEDAVYAKEIYEDLGIITGHQDQLPIYNEYFLCHAPHERLFLYQKWQEGLFPKGSMGESDQSQAKLFFDEIEKLQVAKGRDGKFAFTIPLAMSSKDPKFLALDQISMKTFMQNLGITSAPLHWYVNYSCRDDYGTPHAETSAWAGLHYFCARRGRADGVDGSAVITWPEGNGWLVNQLSDRLKNQIVPDSMAVRVSQTGSEVSVDVWNEAEKKVTRWTAKRAVFATPRFITARLSPELKKHHETILPELEYSPWMVANLKLRKFPTEVIGAKIAWDNVFYESESLGYVVATHQNTSIYTNETVWTYYLPLDQTHPKAARALAYSTSAETWRERIIADMSRAHPDLVDCIESIEVWVWGHAMIKPTPGFFWGKARAKMQEPFGRIHFAHSDMSGISIFEEANYHGSKAADQVMHHGIS